MMVEQAVIDKIVERVVEIARPQKIILFGSAARGDMRAHSDIDLLIIKDGTDKWDCESRIRSGLSGIGKPLDVIVASTATIERYKHSHALVYKPALREGKVMYESPDQVDLPDPDDLPPEEYPPGRYPPDDPREWMARAKHDLVRAKRRVPDEDEGFLESLCFDAQQAAEKAIKARLIALDVEFPYTHDIKELLESLESAGDAIPAEVRAAESLTPYAAVMRYPNQCPLAGEEQYHAAIRAAEAVVDWVERVGF